MPAEGHDPFDALRLNDLNNLPGIPAAPAPKPVTRAEAIEQLATIRRLLDTLGDTLRAANATEEEILEFTGINARFVTFRNNFRRTN